MHSAALNHYPTPTRPVLRGLVCLLILITLAACGFRLKGMAPLPFDTIYTNINQNSAFGAQLQRLIVASSPHTRFVSSVTDAQARLTQISKQQFLREISIGPDGNVEEYELNLVFVFQLTDSQGRVLLPPTTLRSIRELPYDSSALQAKQSEIDRLFQEMQSSLIDRIVRRMTSPEVTQAYTSRSSVAPEFEPVAPRPNAIPDNISTPSPDRRPLGDMDRLVD